MSDKRPLYRIKPKRDFGNGPGFWYGAPGGGEFVKSGFVVVGEEGHEYPGCNVMPGACWFRTIRAALVAIICLQQSHGDADTFWRLIQTGTYSAP